MHQILYVVKDVPYFFDVRLCRVCSLWLTTLSCWKLPLKSQWDVVKRCERLGLTHFTWGLRWGKNRTIEHHKLEVVDICRYYHIISYTVACVDHLVYSVILASFTLGSISKTPEGIEKTGHDTTDASAVQGMVEARNPSDSTVSFRRHRCVTIESLDARMFSPQPGRYKKHKSSVDHGRSSSFCIFQSFQFQGKRFCAMPFFFPLYGCWGKSPPRWPPRRKSFTGPRGCWGPEDPASVSSGNGAIVSIVLYGWSR